MNAMRSLGRFCRILVASALCAGLSVHSNAQLSDSVEASDSSSPPVIDVEVAPEVQSRALPASFEPYLDGVMNALFEDYNLVGAVFSLVYDGQPAIFRGYGYADLESRVPADPAAHLFRPGSVSKLVTWTAVMSA